MSNPINDFERELRDYAEGNGHWSRVERARQALHKAIAAAPALCDCGQKQAAECDKWEPGCSLGQSLEHARVVRAAPAAPTPDVDDPCLTLWKAMNEAEKYGQRSDDKLIVKFLREAGYVIAASKGDADA